MLLNRRKTTNKAETVADHFNYFPLTDLPAKYDGSYGTELSHVVRQFFDCLTNNELNWSQVHGDFKNVVKRGMFVPYPHWAQLYESALFVVKNHGELLTPYGGETTNAKLMGDTMALLKAKHGHHVPRWWLPIMSKLRGQHREPTR